MIWAMTSSPKRRILLPNGGKWLEEKGSNETCQSFSIMIINIDRWIQVCQQKKKTDIFDGLPQFTWNLLTSQDVIGQGSFGAVFVTRYHDETKTKPAETVVVKKLLSKATDFTETFVKEARMLWVGAREHCCYQGGFQGASSNNAGVCVF